MLGVFSPRALIIPPDIKIIYISTVAHLFKCRVRDLISSYDASCKDDLPGTRKSVCHLDGVTASRCTNPIALLTLISAYTASAGAYGAGVHGPGSSGPTLAPSGMSPSDAMISSTPCPGNLGHVSFSVVGSPRRAGFRVMSVCFAAASCHWSCLLLTCPAGGHSPKTLRLGPKISR